MEKTHEKYAKKSRTNLRQKEHQVLDDSWIRKLLNEGSHGTLASTYQNQPFITPILYLYHEKDHSIYFHGAKTGRLRANIHFNPQVAFNVIDFGRILSHQDASEFNLSYKSVTIFGMATLLKNKEKIYSILNQLLRKYAPHLNVGTDYHPIQAEELKITAVYQVKIQEWSGKQQMQTSDYLDSFEYTPPKPV